MAFNFDALHLQRMTRYQHDDAAQAVVTAAAQWYDLCALLRAQGWRNVTPQLIASLAPTLPQPPARAADQ